MERKWARPVWADNILVYARSKQELAHMMKEMSGPLYAHGFTWKKESLAYLHFGDDFNEQEELN
eukprot:7620498-Pyramimonas_sp.AAC.1